MSVLKVDINQLNEAIENANIFKKDIDDVKQTVDRIHVPEECNASFDIKSASKALESAKASLGSFISAVTQKKEQFASVEGQNVNLLSLFQLDIASYRLQSEIKKRQNEQLEEARLKIKKSIVDQKLTQYGVSEDIRPILEETMMNWSNLSPERQDIVLTAAGLVSKGCTYSQPKRDPGAKNPTYLDCSSYVAWAYRQTGHSDVPQDAYTGDFIQSSNFKKISEAELVPGDVGLFNESMAGGNDNHIGIYVGKTNNNQKVWLHCTSGKHTGINGPQVATRDNPTGSSNYITTYRQYQNWKEVEKIQQEEEQPSIISAKNSNGKIDVKDVALKQPTVKEEQQYKKWKKSSSPNKVEPTQVDLDLG